MKSAIRTEPVETPKFKASTRSIRPYIFVALAVPLFSMTAILSLIVFILTLGKSYNFNRTYISAPLARLLLRIAGVKLKLPDSPPPNKQAVYLFNHSSSIDTMILTALRFPQCRNFVSEEVLAIIPHTIMAWTTGTMFIPSQWDHDRRVNTFKRMEKQLLQSRDSLLASPEGSRIYSGEIGKFNRGVVHLATKLKFPVIPIYIDIKRENNQGASYLFKPCTIEVRFLEEISTSEWTEDNVDVYKDLIRDRFIAAHKSS